MTSDLPTTPAVATLRAQATCLLARAYAPYSHDPVVALARTATGRVLEAVTVDNASYGLSSCAIRNLLAQAVGEGCHRQLDVIVLVTGAAEPAEPCGACRHLLEEFAPQAHVSVSRRCVETAPRRPVVPGAVRPLTPTDPVVREMLARARTAAARAVAPYSRFHVGSAVLTGDGSIYVGCNVESRSFPLTFCAERNATFQAIAGGKRDLQAVVIYTPTLAPAASCGACRQVVNEFSPDAWMFSFADGPTPLVRRYRELLPDAFGPHNL